ncbi:hypothetical protein B0H63DRAFT_472630 [Podospora didyma]|uniref:Cyanovirin-N domain-containing protein n=1 Tax=Podospora didyma TaxID=330526 RepID=A0AAE0NPF7_9PEZI|nr:hypothetical protein B0H63DRAFT_472630 [Podospora didyma]
MKTSIVSCAMVLATLAPTVLGSTTVLPNGLELRTADELNGLPITDMIFEGPITEGGPVVNLTGTAQSIYERSFAPKSEVTGSDLDDRDLDTRANDINCKQGSPVNFSQCYEGISYLRRLGRAWCGAGPFSCARVSCSNDCGMFLCNAGNTAFRASCSDIANDMMGIRRECGRPRGRGRTVAAGQMSFGNHYTYLSGASC